jgi:hypothetical protein
MNQSSTAPHLDVPLHHEPRSRERRRMDPKWRMLVYPGLFTLFILAIYGFVLVKSLMHDAHVMTVSVGAMQKDFHRLTEMMMVQMPTMTDNVNSMNKKFDPVQKDIHAMKIDFHIMNEKFSLVQKDFSDINKRQIPLFLKEASNANASISYISQFMYNNFSGMGQGVQQMNRNMNNMNKNMKPMNMMKNMIPFIGD